MSQNRVNVIAWAIVCAGLMVNSASAGELPKATQQIFKELKFSPDDKIFANMDEEARSTPAAIVDTLNRETTAALRDPETTRKLAAMGAEPAPMSPAAFDAFIAKDIENLATLVRIAKIPTN